MNSFLAVEIAPETRLLSNSYLGLLPAGDDLRLPRLSRGRGELSRGGLEELREVLPLRPLVLPRLHDHLELVEILQQLGLVGDLVLVLVPQRLHLLPAQRIAEHGAYLRHRVGLHLVLLLLADRVVRRDVADDGLGEVVDERELHASVLVQARHLLRRHHRHERHPVHVVGDGLRLVHAMVHPARARGTLELLCELEEVHRPGS
mmetsp:Transcript_2211/g.10075  ORF Transcript_2211/g.10075 Transcript_2211/m.10075 type:complete len:204 (+) Transcript_2211:647-1258(+)